jgi:hypothetical protein
MLEDLVLPSRAHQVWATSGMDDPRHCGDRDHYHSYPHSIEYRYNSRGFRDAEWPEDLTQAVWCLGDSFTVGLGSPVAHTWPWILQQRLGRRTINISMDGGSNAWMARRACDIIAAVEPATMVIQWSYTHRSEQRDDARVLDQRWQDFYQSIRDISWPRCDHFQQFASLPQAIQQEIKNDPFWEKFLVISDEERRIDFPIDRAAVLDPSINDDTLFAAADLVEQHRSHTVIVHGFIPEFADDSDRMQQQLTQRFQGRLWIPEIQRLDWARDHHHYDRLTAEQFVTDVCEFIA